MTEQGTNLPEEIRNRIAEKRKEAFDAETSALEQRIGADLESHLVKRRQYIENLVVSKRREEAEARERQLAELRDFEIETLEALESELHQRRHRRLKEEKENREAREKRERDLGKQPVKASAGDAPVEVKPEGSPGGTDQTRKIEKILGQARKFFEQGDLELAQKSVADGLLIDAFNPELVDLDAKIREKLASDSFGIPADQPVKDEKQGKKKRSGKTETRGDSKSHAGEKKSAKFPLRFFAITAVIVTIGLGVIVALKYVPTHLQSRATIAVLPWTTAGGGDDLQLYAATLPEQVVKLLARARSPVNLIGYSTTSNLAGIDRNPVLSLVQLGYSHFVQGQIEERDSRYLIHVQLVDSTGATLWSQDYQRGPTDIMLVPFEIVHRLGDYMESDSPMETPTAVEVKNPEAYLQYLTGMRSLHLPRHEGVDRAVSSFGRSVALDSTFAAAHAGLSTALSTKYALVYSGTGSLLDDAEASAEEAIRWNPGISDGFIAKARVLVEKTEYREALTLLDSASSRSPRESLIPYLRGLAQFRSGQGEKALESLREAYILDPRSMDILELSGLVHLFERSFERAMWYYETAMFFSGDSTEYVISRLSDVIMLDPTLTLSHSRRVTSACLEKLTEDPEDYYILYRLARVLQVSGDILESNTYFTGLENILRRDIRAHPTDVRRRLYLGLTLARLGRWDDAISIGEAALRADSSNDEAYYLLARIYALQMYSPKTSTVDQDKKSRCFELLREAIGRRFMIDQLGSVDLYNVYSHTDIRSILKPPVVEAQ